MAIISYLSRSFQLPILDFTVKLILRPFQYLEEQSFSDERRLFDNFFHSGVYIVPGHELFCAEPGWFRIIFTAKTDALKEGAEI